MRRMADPTGIKRNLIVREEVVEWGGCYLIGTAGNVQLFPCHRHG